MLMDCCCAFGRALGPNRDSGVRVGARPLGGGGGRGVILGLPEDHGTHPPTQADPPPHPHQNMFPQENNESNRARNWGVNFWYANFFWPLTGPHTGHRPTHPLVGWDPP